MGMKIAGYFFADDCELDNNGSLRLTFGTSRHGDVYAEDLEIMYALDDDEAVDLAEALLKHYNVDYTIRENEDA